MMFAGAKCVDRYFALGRSFRVKREGGMIMDFLPLTILSKPLANGIQVSSKQ
jgi:hypothetical protein